MSNFQHILIISTSSPNIRSEAWGWGYEGPTLDSLRKFSLDIEVGFLRGPSGLPSYKTVLHAMHEGWTLMSPPQKLEKGDEESFEEWEWWLTKTGKSLNLCK